MAAPLNDIPVAYLRECFSYDAATGKFTWLDRPLRHFTNPQAYASWARMCLGRPAFIKRAQRGDMCGNVRWEGRRYHLLAQRVAWALETGAWPLEEIDHRDRDPGNNSFANLREASRSLNGFNRRFRPNATGLTGVQQFGQRFAAKIRGDGKKIYLGMFDTPEEAHQAYRAAALLFFEQA